MRNLETMVYSSFYPAITKSYMLFFKDSKIYLLFFIPSVILLGQHATVSLMHY